MLGRVRRTTRTDISLALVMAGFVYLAWVLACWTAKDSAANIQWSVEARDAPVTALDSPFVKTFGSWGRIVFDLAGPLWMVASLYMVIRASRQRRIISWSWLLLSSQGIIAIGIAVWASLAQRPVIAGGAAALAERTTVDWWPAMVVIGVLVWIGTLVWLLLDRLRLRRLVRGSARRDGFRTQAYRR